MGSDGDVHVTVKGDTGKRYIVSFEGVAEINQSTPENMMLYGLNESDTEIESLRWYNFVNWYCDEPDEPQSKSHLRIRATRFRVIPCN